jgi:hypothetical protein
MRRLKLGPVTVNVTFKGWPSSADLVGCETWNDIKLLDSDIRSRVCKEWTHLLSQSTPRLVIRPAVGANEKGMICEFFMWEYRLKMALLAVQRNSILSVAHP